MWRVPYIVIFSKKFYLNFITKNKEGFTDFTFNPKVFPSPAKQIAELKSQGIKFIGMTESDTRANDQEQFILKKNQKRFIMKVQVTILISLNVIS